MGNPGEKFRKKNSGEKIFKRNEKNTSKQGKELATGEGWAIGKHEVREEKREKEISDAPYPHPNSLGQFTILQFHPDYSSRG